MKALTVRQPYASLISLGVKTIETRTKPTQYRGPLLIHAGKGLAHGPELEQHVGPYVMAHRSRESGWKLYEQGRRDQGVTLPLGAIVATCKQVDDLPIVDRGTVLEHDRWIMVDHYNLYLWDELAQRANDITDQLPYGNFIPGNYGRILEDIKAVEQRCPACEGDGLILRSDNDCDGYDCPCPDCSEPCPVCNGATRCAPIPAKGNQGLWEWTP